MVTTQLANYAAAMRFSELPPEVVDRTKALFRDTLGVGLYTSVETPWGRMITDYALQETTQGVSTVVGSGRRTNASAAALANGTLFLGYELEDTSQHIFGHIGPPTIGAALAIAEKVDASGQDLIAAVVAGYEIMGRIGRVLSKKLILSGLHPTANLGAFGAATAAAKLLGLDATGVLNALGLASVQAGGTMQSLNEGAMSRRLYGGRPAQSGVIAAELAQRGFTGPHQALEGLQGFAKAYTGAEIDWQPTLHALGDRFEVLQTTSKPHACCQIFHSAIDAVNSLRKTNDLPPAEVEEIVGEIKYISPIHANADPKTVMAAQYSLPYCLAAALHTGNVGPAAFTDAMMKDPQIRATAARVRTNYPEDLQDPEAFSARVAIRLTGGTTHRLAVRYPKGDPQNPLSPEELDSKFQELAAFRLPKPRVVELSNSCDGLERLTNMTALVTLLAPR
ncbi:MAG: MmgE/PrpD family protein [Gammaproteobacteria bacterium]